LPAAAPSGAPSPDNIKPVSNRDHIFGNPDAPVKIIEFSDTECPFCKRFHPTLERIVKEYDGKVAWVYRHFPLDSLHSKARKEAEATECAAELGGNDKFWAYLERLFAITPSNDGLDLTQLPAIAAYVGIDRGAFSRCMESGKHAQRVADDLADAGNSGGEGTPYSVVIAKNGKKFVIPGAYPYEEVKNTIEQALKER
jgi:protein-disulfide isomerase